MSDLGELEGEDVLSVGIIVRNVGDGLSQAMEVSPVATQRGSYVTIAIRARLDELQFKPIKDTDGLKRVEVYKADTATILAGNAAVEKALDKQQRLIDEQLGSRKSPRTITAEEDSE